MRFLQMADMHFDSPFANLNKNGLGEARRLEQREVFKKIINYISENEIEYLFICGDLYEQQYVRKSTIEFINNQFKSIPDTKVFMVPGNHDPYLQNSYYNRFTWNDNVTIFDSTVKKIDLTDTIDLYGYGFDDFYLKTDVLSTINVENEEKINILLTHGCVDGGTAEDREYNPMTSKEIRGSKFDYIALGHIHKRESGEKYAYTGSCISLGFDELGEHGVLLGEVDEISKKVTTHFIQMDPKEFIEYELDITDINSQEDLIEKINTIEIQENNYYKIILIGDRNFEIKTNEIIKYINSKNIIKIKDSAKIKQNIEEISKENTLKGIFIRKLKELIDDNPEQKDLIQKAMEIGLDNME